MKTMKSILEDAGREAAFLYMSQFNKKELAQIHILASVVKSRGEEEVKAVVTKRVRHERGG